MNDISKEIINSLLSTPYAKIIDSEHVYVRCPLCGDSTKHLDKPHCGIWIVPDQPLIYHCWICEESGIVNHHFLDLLGITDNQVINDVGIYNQSRSGGKKNYLFNRARKNFQPQIPSIEDNEFNRAKLEYMQNRLGINFTYRSLEYLRVIFDLSSFLKLNHLAINSNFARSIYYLNKEYIGFLSITKDMITMRSINPNSKIRYIKYPIFENNPSAMYSYSLPGGVDIFAKNVNLYMAEGPFDILGVFFHIQNMNMENSIYISVNGSSYKKTISYFLKKGLLTNLNIHIYSDRDKSINFYRSMMNEYREWVKSFHIYYNIKSKDCGVKKDEIKIEEAYL